MDVNSPPNNLSVRETKMRIGIVDDDILSKIREAYAYQMMFRDHGDIPQLIYGHRANEDFRLPKENEEWTRLFQFYCLEVDRAMQLIAKSHKCNLILKADAVLFLDQVEVVDLTRDVVKSLGV